MYMYLLLHTSTYTIITLIYVHNRIMIKSNIHKYGESKKEENTLT